MASWDHNQSPVLITFWNYESVYYVSFIGWPESIFFVLKLDFEILEWKL